MAGADDQNNRPSTRFQPGQSGNPAGRPKGSRNATTVALRLCLDRILPPRKDRPVTFDLPPIKSAGDAAAVASAILAAVASGDITPADAGEISKLVETYVKAFETAELAERLERLERMTTQ